MDTNSFGIFTEVAAYYSSKLSEHGSTPRGVDWNGLESQARRFAQLCTLFGRNEGFSVNDLGCGYGAFCEYLADRFARFTYTGIDISKDMIRAASDRLSQTDNARFLCSHEPDQIADYSVASGVFNVRLHCTEREWQDYVEASLAILHRTSCKGFAFNCLTSYSDVDKMRDYLYYANPGQMFDFCKRNFSPHVALLHDYGLFEFTMVVRKQL